MQILWRLFNLVFICVALLIFGVTAFLLFIFYHVPGYNGAISNPYLTKPVTISRDMHAIPHITGESREDVLFGLGIAHAQDRFWQMEMARKAGKGELSSLFGESMLSTDILMRSYNLKSLAKQDLSGLPRTTRNLLEAYVAGVNAWLTRDIGLLEIRYPPEMTLLWHRPEIWTAEDSLLALKVMNVILSGNAGNEMMRLSMARSGLSSNDMVDLFPENRNRPAPDLPDLQSLLGLSLTKGVLPATTDLALLDHLHPEGASNSWVIHGKGSETGQSILVNDPHLGMTAPALWYLAHLRTITSGEDASKSLVGATIPGIPIMILGHNGKMAWSATNAYADVQDLYMERLDPKDPNRYLTPTGYQDFTIREEVIPIRFGDDVTYRFKESRHGPVLPADYRDADQVLPPGHVLSLSWTALLANDQTMVMADRLWDVERVEDFSHSLDIYRGPVQAMLVADSDGGSRLVVAGSQPLRHPDNDIDGRAPNPGWDPLYDWQGLVPVSEWLIRDLGDDHHLATANTQLTQATDLHRMTHDWPPSWRLDRIDELLGDHGILHSLSDQQQFLMDSHSPAYARLNETYITLKNRYAAGLDVRTQAILERLTGWDGDMQGASLEPLIITAWHRKNLQLIFEDELGPAFNRFWRARPEVTLPILEGRSHRNWCDNITTETIEESCAEITAQAFLASLTDLEARFGDDWRAWRWDEAHPVRNRHIPLSLIPVIGDLFTITRPISGGPFTINRAQGRFSNERDPYSTGHGAGFRAIYDLSALEHSLFMQATGQSGRPFSTHYADLADLWTKGQMIRIPLDPKVIAASELGRWTLQPQ